MHQLVYRRKQQLQSLYALGPVLALLLAVTMVLLLAREAVISVRILSQVP